MADVKIAALRKSFNTLEVLQGIDIDISDGQFVVLVGPSGCGKSTLLRLLAGLDKVSGGEIIIGGDVVNDLLPAERDIAMVFQSYALYPHMTVGENMAFSLKLKKMPKAEINERVNNAAELLELGHLLNRLPKELSGGQRQRVAMGRAIVRNPRVFLFDEPLSNLDAKLRVQMRAEIKALHQRLRTTSVYVTHDQVEAMTMGDKIVLMNKGRIEQQGAPLELYDYPKTKFVAEFIGSPSMNILRGVVTADSGGEIVCVMADGTKLPLTKKHAAHVGHTVDYGIRPEHIKITEHGLKATLSLIEPTGSETHIQMTLGHEKIDCIVHDRFPSREGETISISIEPDKAHLFCTDTGNRIIID